MTSLSLPQPKLFKVINNLKDLLQVHTRKVYVLIQKFFNPLTWSRTFSNELEDLFFYTFALFVKFVDPIKFLLAV
jgi:hypothetical protein